MLAMVLVWEQALVQALAMVMALELVPTTTRGL